MKKFQNIQIWLSIIAQVAVAGKKRISAVQLQKRV
jgi:hypothetical protein